MSMFKAPLGLALAVLLSSTAFAQRPEGASQQPRPQVERQAPTPSPQTNSPQTAPTMQRSAPGAVTQQRTYDNAVRPDSRGGSRSVTVDRSDRRWDRDRRGPGVVVRDRRGPRVVVRDRVRPAFAFIGGPRIVVRPGWCRGLHRGWHTTPDAGRHAGTHRGLFRC